MTASVDILTERKENVLRVPLSAVTTRTQAQLDKEKETGKDRKGTSKASEEEKPETDGAGKARQEKE